MKECTCVNQVSSVCLWHGGKLTVLLPGMRYPGELQEVVCLNRFDFLFSKTKQNKLLLLCCLFILNFALCTCSCISEL